MWLLDQIHLALDPLNNADGNRGSGGSNTTKGTSTDTSSRHSNASTSPSSADMAQNPDEGRTGTKNRTQETSSRLLPKSSTGFFDRAGKTLSFGMQKHGPQSPSKNDLTRDVTPIPTLQREDEAGRTRAMTASTASTATPPKVAADAELDLGGDFGSMFSKFNKRASAATLRTEEDQAVQRPGKPALLSTDRSPPVDPSPSSLSSLSSNDGLMESSFSPIERRAPSAPRHQPSFEYRSSTSPGGMVEDEDAKFLADSVAATRCLSDDPVDSPRATPPTRDEKTFKAPPRKPVASNLDPEDNMFAGTPARFSRPSFRSAPKPPSPPRGSKLMTTAEFEKYQKEKEREHLEKAVYGRSASDDEDEDDDINYDDDDDEEEKQKLQTRLRRNKQAQMLAYRQRNMKTTGNLNQDPPVPASRPSLPAASLSAPQLSLAKTPSPEPAHVSDDDEEVPLAILQAHGFPNKNRSSSRLSMMGSVANLQMPNQQYPPRPASAVGEYSTTNSRRGSALPAFARNLPQDPFVGASVSRPAMRESLAFGGGYQPGSPQIPQPPTQPGGLVGVIANEERSRAIRRGSPHIDTQRLGGPNVDPIMGIPANAMYGAQQGAGGIPRMPQGQAMSPADQAQIHMSQQMTQFMQMQMQFMQMMAENQGRGGGGNYSPQMPFPMMPPQMQQQQPQQPPPPQQQQPPYGGLSTRQSIADFSAPMMSGNPSMQPRRMDSGLRTMSMVQPSVSSPFNGGGYGPPAAGLGVGYTPSIAPSERSNVGLPGRYRPVSQASGAMGHQRSASMSGSISQADDAKSKSTIRVLGNAKTGSEDDDDDEGWAAMRAKREQKKSMWKSKKLSSVF